MIMQDVFNCPRARARVCEILNYCARTTDDDISMYHIIVMLYIPDRLLSVVAPRPSCMRQGVDVKCN